VYARGLATWSLRAYAERSDAFTRPHHFRSATYERSAVRPESSAHGPTVLEALALYPDRAELLRQYPELEDEDIRQVLAYAAASVDDKVIDLPKSA